MGDAGAEVHAHLKLGHLAAAKLPNASVVDARETPMGAALCGNQISGAPPIDETCFRSYFCAMVWRFYAIDATFPPCSMARRLTKN